MVNLPAEKEKKTAQSLWEQSICDLMREENYRPPVAEKEKSLHPIGLVNLSHIVLQTVPPLH